VGSLTQATRCCNITIRACSRSPAKSPPPLVWNPTTALTLTPERPRRGVVNTDLNNGKMVDLLGPTADMTRVDYVRDNNQRHILQTFPGPDTETRSDIWLT